MHVVLLLVLSVAVVAIFVFSRGGELFVLSVRRGRVLLLRGRIPQAVLNDLSDVVRRAGVERATIRAVKASGQARLVAVGVDEGVEQRLRNTLGTHSLHKLSAAPAMAGRNLGQLVGITWLAWLLSRRR